ncbi:unnamed protein product [Owenia fusiformis]|uniref:CHCH domain-containing protein n=1 Tax=Owenia fusiformis TaxID=6347 RepID=A0A8S4NNB5_OWEFU|nr:unnamed protein product [Owenia fusiformis]
MSYCKDEGKDKVIFVTEKDHNTPSTAKLDWEDEENDDQPGLILNDGSINWDCPCLGGMASGPCGIEFREAFSCFHYSKEEPKGTDCLDQFRGMQACMQQYPTLYPTSQDEKEEDLVAAVDDLEKDGTSSAGSGSEIVDNKAKEDINIEQPEKTGSAS